MLDQIDFKVPSVRFRKWARCRRPNWINSYVFRNISDSRNFVITDPRQDPTLPAGSLWATTASPLTTPVALGVNDTIQLLQQADTQGYQRVRTERMLRRA
jgi:hypothetical protein